MRGVILYVKYASVAVSPRRLASSVLGGVREQARIPRTSVQPLGGSDGMAALARLEEEIAELEGRLAELASKKKRTQRIKVLGHDAELQHPVPSLSFMDLPSDIWPRFCTSLDVRARLMCTCRTLHARLQACSAQECAEQLRLDHLSFSTTLPDPSAPWHQPDPFATISLACSDTGVFPAFTTPGALHAAFLEATRACTIAGGGRHRPDRWGNLRLNNDLYHYMLHWPREFPCCNFLLFPFLRALLVIPGNDWTSSDDDPLDPPILPPVTLRRPLDEDETKLFTSVWKDELPPSAARQERGLSVLWSDDALELSSKFPISSASVAIRASRGGNAGRDLICERRATQSSGGVWISSRARSQRPFTMRAEGYQLEMEFARCNRDETAKFCMQSELADVERRTRQKNGTWKAESVEDAQWMSQGFAALRSASGAGSGARTSRMDDEWPWKGYSQPYPKHWRYMRQFPTLWTLGERLVS